MIVLRNRDLSLQEKDFTLKRKYKYAIGKLRTSIANRIIKPAAEREINKFEETHQQLKNIPLVQNKKAKHFLNKTAADHNMIVTNYKPSSSLEEGACYVPAVSENFLYTQANEYSAAGRTRAARVTRNIGTRVRRQMDAGAPRPHIIYVPKSSSPATLAHEMGHATISKKTQREAMKRRKALLKEGIDPASQELMERNIHSDLHLNVGTDAELGNNLTNNGVLKVWKNVRRRNAEERRATKEGLRLLKQSGTMSSQEMKQAKKELNLSYDTYRREGRLQVLSSLGQKIQIPSRRTPGFHYESTMPYRKFVQLQTKIAEGNRVS